MARRPADLGIKPDVLRDLAEAEAHEQSLYSFVARAWQEIEGRPFKGGWAFEAICEHLEAVSAGEIDFLIINVPPRSGKTTTATVCWPAWTWARRKDKANPRIGPSVQFLCGAYSARKAQDDAVTSRRLIGSAWYQRLWGTRYQITEDRDNRERFDTSEHGSRISTGMAESLGKGGLIRLLDDPHKTDEMESDEVRKSVLRDYDEVWKTRGNDAVNQAEVVIMQRLARDDLTGHILDSDIGEDVVHLWIPARFEADRACRTIIGWRDPREEDGESFHPERFPDVYLNSLETSVGPYAWAGQYQQRPAPRGGGIIKEEWWQNWPPPGEEDQWEFAEIIDGRKKTVLEYPEFIFILAATDGAFTEKQGNDPCAATVWGIFKGPYGEAPTAEGKLMPRILLIEAWRERLELSRYAARLKEMCQRRNVDRLLIENKASGYPVAQELRRLLSAGDAVVEIVDPGKADKVARLHSTVPLFSGGCVYRPSRRWADQVAKETAEMPNGRYDDLADTVSMALNWLRRSGVALLSAEAKRKDTEERLFRGRAAGKTVAQRYGVV